MTIDLHGVPVAADIHGTVKEISNSLIAKRNCRADPAMCRWAVRLATLAVEQWMHEPNVARAQFEEMVPCPTT